MKKSSSKKYLVSGIVGLTALVASGGLNITNDVWSLHYQACDMCDSGDYEKAIAMWRGIWSQTKNTEDERRYKIALNIAQAYVMWWEDSKANDSIMTAENLLRAEKYLRIAKRSVGAGFLEEKKIHGRLLPVYKDIVAFCRKKAEQGSVDAQYALARLYTRHDFEASNYKAAIKWAKKAAGQGYALAQTFLGSCYCNGRGVKVDYAEAVKWYRKSAEQGDPAGLRMLGYMYQEGWGVDKNYAEAVKWYRKAVEKGDTQGLWMLGLCYMKGNGVPKDEKEAVRLIRRAAEVEQGLLDGAGWRGMYNLGICYRDGRGVKKNIPEAIKCFKVVFSQGEVEERERARAVLKELGENVDQEARLHDEVPGKTEGDVRGAHEMTPPLGMARGIGTIAMSPCNLVRAWPLGFEEGDLFVGVILLPVCSTLVMSGCTVCDIANGALDVCSFGTYGNWLYTDGYTPWFWQRHNSYRHGIMTECNKGALR